MLLVIFLIVVPLLRARVPADGADVDHAVAELDKGAALDGDVQVGDVVQAEADELLVPVLPDPLDEAVGVELRAVLVRRQAVLGEAEVEEGRHVHLGRADLLLLLDEVAAAHEADGALLAEAGEELEHLGRDGLAGKVSAIARWGKGARGRYCFTRRAGVRVPSTSKRQMVFLRGRSSKGGKLGAMVAEVRSILASFFLSERSLVELMVDL